MKNLFVGILLALGQIMVIILIAFLYEHCVNKSNEAPGIAISSILAVLFFGAWAFMK